MEAVVSLKGGGWGRSFVNLLCTLCVCGVCMCMCVCGVCVCMCVCVCVCVCVLSGQGEQRISTCMFRWTWMKIASTYFLQKVSSEFNV